MSNERFDRLIKKNLESVRPSPQPGAWDRFRKRLPVAGFWPWLAHYGGWVLSGLMLGGWLMTLYTLHENQQVLAQLNKTPITRNQPARPMPAGPDANALTYRRVDTVYIVKRTVVEYRPAYDPRSQEPRLAGSPEQATQLTESSAGPEGSFPTKTTYTPTRTGRPRTRSASAPNTPSIVADRAIAQTANPKAARTLPDTDRSSAGPVSPAPAQPRVDGTSEATTSAATTPDQQPTVSDATTTQPATRPDTVAHERPAPASSAQESAKPAEQRRPSFRLSSLHPRVGIEMMGMSGGVGAGPAIEFFPTENVGVSVGLQASRFHSENHDDLKGFNSATGQQFIDQYRAYLPARYDKIEAIMIQTAVVSIPINLKYYVPLNRHWSLLFQTGTRLDLAAYNEVRYESYFLGDEQHNRFEVNARPPVFHNFLFGTGIQYRQPRISLQFSPYYVYNFRSLANAPTGSTFGIRASVWLDLFK